MGCATAFALLQRGAGRVALVERRAPGAGDSGLSFSMVRRHYTNPVLVRLAISGSRTIIDWADEVGVGASGYARTGYLLTVPPALAERCAAQCALGRECGLDSRFVEASELPALEPLLALDGIAGAAYEPDGGFADVHAMIGGWFAASCALGLEAHLGTRVEAIETDEAGVSGVRTDRGTIATRTVVLATGAWARELAAPLGLDLALALRRLQVAVLRQPPGAPLPAAVVSDAVTNVVVRPAAGRDFCAVAYHGQEDVAVRDDCDERADAAYEGTVRAALGGPLPRPGRGRVGPRLGRHVRPHAGLAPAARPRPGRRRPARLHGLVGARLQVGAGRGPRAGGPRAGPRAGGRRRGARARPLRARRGHAAGLRAGRPGLERTLATRRPGP